MVMQTVVGWWSRSFYSLHLTICLLYSVNLLLFHWMQNIAYSCFLSFVDVYCVRNKLFLLILQLLNCDCIFLVWCMHVLLSVTLLHILLLCFQSPKLFMSNFMNNDLLLLTLVFLLLDVIVHVALEFIVF